MIRGGNNSIRHAAGSLLVVGLSATELTGLERAWLKLIRPAGIILFRRNIADAKQVRSLLSEAAAYCTSAHLRCVDVEGGTVDRLRDAVAPMPSAQAVANTKDAHLMQKHGALIAKEIRAFGFNTTLAPVLDLALPVSAKVMGTRAVSANPATVVQYARAFLYGLNTQSVTGCAKHFPGLGGGSLDSHLETPSIRRSWKDLWNHDMAPYRELASELPMIMINHAAYPDTRSGHAPATASAFWPTTVLQKRIGYKGLIFSDDMEMGGILKFAPMEEASILALQAGLHLLEICHSPELILRCYESLIHESERSASFRKLLLERAAISARLRKSRFSATPEKAFSPAQLQSLRESVLRFTDTVRDKQSMEPAE